MVDIAIPQVNFYSMLSGLGDTLQANRQAQARKEALAIASTPGADGKVDFGKAILGLNAAGDTQGAALFSQLQNHQDALAHQKIEDARAAEAAAASEKHFQMNYGLQQSNAARAQANADREWNYDSTEERTEQAKANGLDPTSPAGQRFVLTGALPTAPTTPAGFRANPDGSMGYITGGPHDPTVVAETARAKAEAAPGKPIPFETLAGTKFMVRQPDGSYGVVNPPTVGQPAAPQPAMPQPVVPNTESAPAAPAATSPVVPVTSVASAPPANATVSSPAAQPAPQVAQPQADLTAVDPQTGRRENWLKAQSPDVQDYIKKVADYQIDPRTSSTKGGHREQIMSAVAQYDPTYDQNTFGSRAKAIKDFSTGTQGNSIRSFDVATDHLDTLQKYVEAAKNGDYRVINSLRQKWLQETGSPLPTNIQAVAPIVGAEVSKAIIGSNNALADREELRKPLNSANSPDQLMGAIQAYKALMTGQLKGLGKQYEDTTGRKDFNNRLRDNTRKVLLGGDTDSTSQPNVTSSGIKWSVQ